MKEITNSEAACRYSGHINLKEIGRAGQQAIQHARVLIAGAGGLGSPVALYLAAAGVGTIGIADADTVGLSNLQRQIIHGTPDLALPKAESASRAMTRINPFVTTVIHNTFINTDNCESIIGAYDVVADCTDRFATRLLVSDTCHRLGKSMVHAAVEHFRGQVFTQMPGSATFRDIFGDDQKIPDTGCALKGILNTVVGVAGSLQATEVLKVITGAGNLLVDRLLVFDALAMDFNLYDLR